jgi:hypothetical protein
VEEYAFPHKEKTEFGEKEERQIKGMTIKQVYYIKIIQALLSSFAYPISINKQEIEEMCEKAKSIVEIIFKEKRC